MRKKILSGIVGATLVFSFAAPTWAQTNGDSDIVPILKEELSVEQKFDFLKEKGIFHGKADGKAYLEDKMTRAQLATVLYRVYPLVIPKIYKDPFEDVTTDHWAWEAIFAVTRAGLMEDEDGKFDPNGIVSLEELAATVVKAMKLNTDDYASIDLPGSDWAQRYLAAALSEEVLAKATDYTVDAYRSDLVNTMYAVYNKEQGKLEIVAGALEPSLTYAKLENGNYEFTFNVKNQTEQVQTIGLGGQKFDYILYKDGKQIEKFSDGKVFIMIYQEIKLKQGEEYEVKHVLENPGPGNYKIEFWIADANWPDAKVTKEFVVE